jgi:predicted transcriptional regulator
MPHKRSLQGKITQRQREQNYAVIKVQRTAAWQYIRETEFHDRLIGETVCRTDINTITDELAKLFGQPDSEAIPNVEHGLVLIGSLREF